MEKEKDGKILIIGICILLILVGVWIYLLNKDCLLYTSDAADEQ